MTREDFIFALEQEGLIDAERDENWRIDVEETIKSENFKKWCYMPSWERLSLKVIYNILDQRDIFN